MVDDPEVPGNGKDQPADSIEANTMIESFGRIRNREKRRILMELIQAIAEDQSETNGGG